jgi:cation transport regulator ChaC
MEWNNSSHKLKSINHFLHGIYQLLWISMKKHFDTMLEIGERMGVPLVHNISIRQSIEYIVI